ncbi:dTDP-4-dehydrorhamnose reductase [Streptomyces sp. AM 4-1-1]|uniref:dTDP-4-dehydrorhamnose reductase n=1 Tax=Streptomyces sp. AM 4-1-1 TaxID=3028710 RepID=UPI0023B96A78|nr:dTDP-4-dehydrorhamnose reductase [Streptomyces sp. AM 4-1-1]WEH33725.1 dTDP-4-dehydrorhamnose reductase [Streptomyces sp. AM 4-1-1]
MSRWLVTGAGGMLGRAMTARLAREGRAPVALDRRALDLTDPAAVGSALAAHRPAVVVNCAAWTAVDDAESREPDALRINGDGVRNLAAACAARGVVLLHVSTDYVFGGDATTPYPETAVPAPRTAYGRTKLAGERAVLDLLPTTGYVVRTAWLYGEGGANFVRTMIRLEATRDTLDVVDDQRGQPTWSADLAHRLAQLGCAAVAGLAPPGIYHGTSGGEGSWCDLARETFRLLGADPARVRATTGAALARASAGTTTAPRPAPRPAYSVLGHARWRAAGLDPIRDWRAALAQALPALRAAAGPRVTAGAGARAGAEVEAKTGS